MWHVYILECADGSFYTGVTADIKDRLKRHNSGSGSKHTRTRRPVKLLYLEEFSVQKRAINREKEIKLFSIQIKQRLIKYGLGRRSSPATAPDSGGARVKISLAEHSTT